MKESTSTLRPIELAERWKTTPGRLANLRSAGRGPAFLRIGTAIRYEESSVRAFELAHRVHTLDSLAA